MKILEYFFKPPSTVDFASSCLIATRMLEYNRRKKYPLTLYRSLATTADIVIKKSHFLENLALESIIQSLKVESSFKSHIFTFAKKYFKNLKDNFTLSNSTFKDF